MVVVGGDVVIVDAVGVVGAVRGVPFNDRLDGLKRFGIGEAMESAF